MRFSLCCNLHQLDELRSLSKTKTKENTNHGKKKECNYTRLLHKIKMHVSCLRRVSVLPRTAEKTVSLLH